MDDKTQKERLEQELRFLKESFEAEVISKEEFEKGKERIERKLKEIQTSKPSEEKIEETKKIEPEKQEKIEEQREETIQIEKKEFAPPKTEIKEENKFFRYAVIFVVLILVIFFSYSYFKNKVPNKINEIKFVAVCSSNEDCKQEGKEGFCLNPGAIDARCEFRVEKTNVLVLNDRKNCFNCDTQRVLSILEQWFGAINVKEVDYNTEEGKVLAEKIEARLLPTYILDENITKKQSYEQFKNVFIKKDDNFVLSEDAAASTFYFNRDNIPNKLDFFVIPNDSASIKTENNLKEFLDNFKEVKFEKHLSNDKLAQELGIKNFPTFLVNNRVKFSGILPAETIKNNFCKLNKLSACEKSLSKNLV